MRRSLIILSLLVPLAANAAAPVIEARATTAATGSDSTSFTVTRATVAAGQQQLCFVVADNDSATTLTWPGTFTVIESISEAGDFVHEAAIESMSGGESATFTVTLNTSQMAAARCYALSGASGTTTEASNTEAGAVTSIDPAAITGLTSGDYTFISTASSDQYKGGIGTFPTGYSNTGSTFNSPTTGSVTLAWAEKSATGVTGDDPSAFSHINSGDQMGAITVAFHPAPSTPTVTLSDATPDIDTTVTATLSGAFGAGGNPTLVTFASGDTVACSAATSTTCQFPLDFAELAASGDLGSTKVESATTLTVTNGTETSDSTAVNIQIPASGYAIVDLTCTAGTDCSDDSEAIVPMIAGDDCAIKVNTGSLNHLSTECAPVFNGGAFSYTVARYDESATAWLAQEAVSVTPPTSCRGIVGDIVFDIVQDILKEMQCVD